MIFKCFILKSVMELSQTPLMVAVSLLLTLPHQDGMLRLTCPVPLPERNVWVRWQSEAICVRTIFNRSTRMHSLICGKGSILSVNSGSLTFYGKVVQTETSLLFLWKMEQILYCFYGRVNQALLGPLAAQKMLLPT